MGDPVIFIASGEVQLVPSVCSPIGNEESIGSYELHIAVKDYCFGRDDRLIGVSVMQLKDIQDQV